MPRPPAFRRTFTGAPWEAQVGYCRALRAGDHVHVTGTAPVADDGSVFAPGDAEAQTRRCLEIICAALKTQDAKPSQVVRTRIFVTDISLWQQIGRAHAAVFGEHPPCTTMVQVAALIDPAMLVEIEADAFAPLPPPQLAGDERFHLDEDQLDVALSALPPPPRDLGRLVHIVRRHADHSRELPHSALMSVAHGLVGDLWSTSGQGLDAQLAVMQADIGTVIANGQSPALFGDQLHLDLDLSLGNLPIGSQLRIGPVLLQVTPKAHTGCSQYRRRFGAAALSYISEKHRRDRRMRGLYLRVIEPGRVTVDDPVEVCSRPSRS